MDLLAALLSRHYPVTLEDLVRDVPGYIRPGLSKVALRRAFERDKADLRALGIPIETIVLEDGESAAYRLDAQRFYLPYLVMAARYCVGSRERGHAHTPAQSQPSTRTQPRRVDRYGYRALPTLLFEPEELRYLFTAGRLEALGDAILAETTTSALRKLRFDLPIGAVSSFAEHILPPRARPRSGVLTALWQALATRKRVAITYHSIGTDARTQRRVEPYGLFLSSGHWYLVGRDIERSALRTFRVSRISAARPNATRANTPDYEIPHDFVLREHAQSRHAWEIGDGDAIEAVVEFYSDVGAITAAARLGTPVPGTPKRRRFQMRRIDSFARWLLSFGADARPVSPEPLCRVYAEIAQRTLALYTDPPHATTPRDGDEVVTAESETEIGTRAAPPPRVSSRTADERAMQQTTAQLQRLLAALPEIGVEGGVPLDELAERTGIDARTLLGDLEAVEARGATPAGFIEGVQVYLEHDRMAVFTPHFLRPPRLTATELCALELGLSMLRRESSPEDQPWIDRARVRLRGAIMSLPAEVLAELPDARHARVEAGELGVVTPEDRTRLAVLRRALDARRRLRLVYRAGSAAAMERVVQPYRLLFANGNWYLVAYCEARLSVRRFRLDRIDDAELLSGSYEVPVAYISGESVGGDQVNAWPGPDHQSCINTEPMRVRYSSRIARWIAEREGREVASDGSLILTHPLADPRWAVRYVLQYGPDAELLEPASLRRELLECLGRILARERGG